MYGENSQALRITFQPTDNCNLNCSYCYQNNKGNSELKLSDAIYFLDKLFQNDKVYFKGFLHDDYLNVILDFMGGESTLCIEFVDKIVDYFIECCVKYKKFHWLVNCEIWLQTNGTTYFNPKVSDFIRKHHDRLELPITLDGSKDCHDACRKYYDGRGSYDDVIKAMKDYISTYHVYPNTKITISPENIDHMFDAAKAMMDLGFKKVRLGCVCEDVWEPKHDEIFRQQLQLYYDYIEKNNIDFKIVPYASEKAYESGLTTGTCGCFGNLICVDCHGLIYLCQRFSEICDFDDKPRLSIGTVKEGITETGIKIIQRIKESRKLTEQTPGCKDCKIGHICESCPAFSYEHFGVTYGISKVNCRKNHIAYEELQKHLKRKEIKKENTL